MISHIYRRLRDALEPHPFPARSLDRLRRQWDLRRDPMLAFMLDDLQPGNVVYDIGAGLGLYSFVLSSRFPGIRTVAFEPNPSTRKRLLSAIAREPASYQITVSPSALGDAIGTQPFYVSSQAGRSSLRVFNAERRGAAVCRELEVDCTTIDQLVESGRYSAPDALKIDVEGYEYEVILGALGTIEKFHPRIYFESHAREGPRQSAPLILELLAGYGYVFTEKNSRFRGLVQPHPDHD